MVRGESFNGCVILQHVITYCHNVVFDTVHFQISSCIAAIVKYILFATNKYMYVCSYVLAFT